MENVKEPFRSHYSESYYNVPPPEMTLKLSTGSSRLLSPPLSPFKIIVNALSLQLNRAWLHTLL
jgi:hypothetical protein